MVLGQADPEEGQMAATTTPKPDTNPQGADQSGPPTYSRQTRTAVKVGFWSVVLYGLYRILT